MRLDSKPARAVYVSLLISLVGEAPSARAGGYELAPQSAEASGTADAATARSATPSAAHYNPAALVDGGGLRVGLGASLALSTIDAEAAEGALEGPWSASTARHPSLVPSFYASYAWNDWAVSLAAHVPYGSHVEWPADWPHRFDAVLSSLKVGRLAPSVGHRFGAVRVAGGVHLNLGELESQRATNHIAEEGSVHLLLHGYSFGVHLGLFATLSERVDLGVSYQSRSKLRLRGDADFEVPAAFEPRYPDQHASARFPLPDRIALGARFDLGEVADLYTDLTVSVWSVNDVLVIDFEDELTDDSVRVSNWRTTAALRVGADVALLPELTARAGLFADGLFGAPPPSAYLSPTSPDSVRLGGSLGLGVAPSPAVAIDASYQYVRLLARESTSQDAPLARYEGRAHVVSLALRFTHAPRHPEPAAPASSDGELAP